VGLQLPFKTDKINSSLHVSIPVVKRFWHYTSAESRDVYVWGPKEPHIWNPRPHIAYHYITFITVGSRTRDLLIAMQVGYWIPKFSLPSERV